MHLLLFLSSLAERDRGMQGHGGCAHNYLSRCGRNRQFSGTSRVSDEEDE